MERVPVMVYDTLDQTAPLLVPHLPAEKLNVLDFRDYRRNILTGPPGMSQLDWIRAAVHHLMESLDIQPVTMNVLVRLCEEIVADGQIATLPRLLKRLERPGHQTPPHRALQNRLLAILMTDQQVFGCERGFDLGQIFRRSCVFNLKGATPQLRKLIYYDHWLGSLTGCRSEESQAPSWLGVATEARTGVLSVRRAGRGSATQSGRMMAAPQ